MDFYQLKAMTWDGIGAIITAIAVIVAIVANCITRRQMRTTIKMHEQIKNIELMDKRLDMIAELQKNNEMNSVRLKLLFGNNPQIFRTYEELLNRIMNSMSIEEKMKKYISHFTTPDGCGGYKNDVKEGIRLFKEQLKEQNCPDSVDADFKNFCDKHEWSEQIDEVGNSIRYNYYELDNALSLEQAYVIACKSKLIKLMEAYISEGITPLSKK